VPGLTLNLLTTTVVAPPSNASKWKMGFNSAFKGLKYNKTLYCALNSLCLNLKNSMRHSNVTAFPKPDYYPGFCIHKFYLNATKITKIGCLFSLLNEDLMMA
jgi:hypothetical protein